MERYGAAVLIATFNGRTGWAAVETGD